MTYDIRYTPGNKTNSLPPQWDIFEKGKDDALITVWKSKEHAEAAVVMCEILSGEREQETKKCSKCGGE
jgi:hypothetical protein